MRKEIKKTVGTVDMESTNKTVDKNEEELDMKTNNEVKMEKVIAQKEAVIKEMKKLAKEEKVTKVKEFIKKNESNIVTGINIAALGTLVAIKKTRKAAVTAIGVYTGAVMISKGIEKVAENAEKKLADSIEEEFNNYNETHDEDYSDERGDDDEIIIIEEEDLEMEDDLEIDIEESLIKTNEVVMILAENMKIVDKRTEKLEELLKSTINIVDEFYNILKEDEVTKDGKEQRVLDKETKAVLVEEVKEKLRSETKEVK